MKFYFAPMEGIAGYIYRNAFNEYFDNIDKYFSPFITTSSNGIRKMKEFRDILPENNNVKNLVPQLLSNNSSDFLKASGEIEALGYREINLNLGCPSGTVVSKKRGAGFLTDTEGLDNFLYDIFSKCDLKVSIKTRIGYTNEEEFSELLRIFNRYPVYELIIHPRTREDYYKAKIHFNIFGYALDSTKHSLCYNGDIFTVRDYENIVARYKGIDSVMLGRGILRNPSVVQNIMKNEDVPDYRKIFEFHDRLYSDYKDYLSGDAFLLAKMKEVWLHMVNLMEDTAKCTKKIKKAKNLYEYNSVVNEFRRKLLNV